MLCLFVRLRVFNKPFKSQLQFYLAMSFFPPKACSSSVEYSWIQSVPWPVAWQHSEGTASRSRYPDYSWLAPESSPGSAGMSVPPAASSYCGSPTEHTQIMSGLIAFISTFKAINCKYSQDEKLSSATQWDNSSVPKSSELSCFPTQAASYIEHYIGSNYMCTTQTDLTHYFQQS